MNEPSPSPRPRFRLLPRFDPRLAAELRTQRASIAKGLACVLATSLLTTATIPIITKSVTAIQEAAPSALSRREAHAQAVDEGKARLNQVRERLNLNDAQVDVGAKALADAQETAGAARLDAEAAAVALALEKRPEEVRAALAGTRNLAQGNLAAVGRLALYAVLILALYGLKYVFTRGQVYYLSRAAARLSADLRVRLYAKLQRLPVSYFGAKRAGAIQSVLTNDVNVYQTAVTIVRDSIDGPVKAVGAFVVVVATEWRLALVTVLFLPVMAVVIHRNGRTMKEAQREVQESLSGVSATTVETLQGVRVVRAFAAEERVQGLYAGMVEANYRNQIEATRVQARLRPLVELLGAGAIATILVACGWLSYQGSIKLGAVAGLLVALDVINQGVRNLSSVANTYGQVQAASERIHQEILDQPEPPDEARGAILRDPLGRIEFQNVSFRYPDGTEALRNLSFVLEPGTSLALVGPSGAGKSTVADLILRFYEPTEGRILFDGVDLRELDARWLRGQIGVVPQQTFLFAGPIAENVRMGKPDATDAEVEKAAALAHADEFVRTLPARYETVLGEGGGGLSGGQRQRVAIARALVREPSLLLLDEATSALDAESERAVTEALDEVMRERTTLFIAHRLTTAARADRILVMARGEAVESGSHAELLAAGGAYAGLFAAFSGGVL